MPQAHVHAPADSFQAIEGVLLDIDGVVTVGDTLLPGAREAIARLRAAGMPCKFITNTTRRPRSRVVADLARLGLTVALDDVFTPAILARAFLISEKLEPFLVVHPDLRADFADLDREPPARTQWSGTMDQGEAGASRSTEGSREAIVVGDAGAFFTYDLLNAAHRKLLRGAAFLALAKNRSFQDRDGDLSLDAGPFVAALEFASGRAAKVFGKPAPAFFESAVGGLGLAAGHVVMIGDDAEADVGGAMAVGLMGVLVQTGKYRPGQEAALAQPPTLMARDLSAAVDRLLG